MKQNARHGDEGRAPEGVVDLKREDAVTNDAVDAAGGGKPASSTAPAVKTLFLTEMWEKFTFFGTRSILSLFFVHSLMFSEKDTALYYGAFLALSYFTPILGGWVADRTGGYRRAIEWGAFLLALSQLLLFAGASVDPASGLTTARTLTFAALFLIVVGNGLFKPNITSELSRIHASRPDAMDVAFSNYYLFLNFGALLGQFLVPFFGDVVVDGVRDASAFRWGYLASFVAMAFGWAFYRRRRRAMLETEITRTGMQMDAGDSCATTGSACGTAKEEEGALKGCSLPVRIVLSLSAGLALWGVVGWASFEPGASPIAWLLYPFIYGTALSLALFIYSDPWLTRRERGGILSIFVSALFIIFFWATYEQAGTSLTFIAENQTDRHMLGLEWTPAMIGLFNPLFIMFVAAPFAWLWKRLDALPTPPSNLMKQAWGLLLMALSFAVVAENVRGLGDGLLWMGWLVLLYFLQTCAEMCLSPIGLSLVGKKAPARYLGLLFGLFYLANAAGYALSGVLAGLMPPTRDKFEAASALGIDLRNVLADPAAADPSVLSALAEARLPTEYPLLWGLRIETLHDFFLVFFAITLVSAVLLIAIDVVMRRRTAAEDVESVDGRCSPAIAGTAADGCRL